jgi:hypothetical protein
MRYPWFLVLMCLASSGAAAQSAGSPFALHAGAAYGRVPATDFETVNALSGQDLFSQVEARDSRADFAVFLSQRLWAGTDAGPQLYATLGTNVTRPGEVLYFGGSVGVSRAMVTVGLATGVSKEGISPVSDQVFRGSSDRELFASLSSRRDWGFFAGVSVAVIR